MASSRPGFWTSCILLAVGSAVGAFAFLAFVTILLGSPIADSLLSVHGVLVQDDVNSITAQQEYEIVQLLRGGKLMTADGLLSQMQNYYSSQIQVVIGLFFVFGLLSFFAVRLHSERQIEETASRQVSTAFETLLKSHEFHKQLSNQTQSAISLEMESVQKTLESFSNLSDRMRALEGILASRAEKTEE